MNQINIDNIPVDVWPKIFSNLPATDLFNCRLVNKKFKHFSDHTKSIYRLSIDKYNFNDDKFWDNNKESIEEKDIINLKCFRIIQKLEIFNLKLNLNYLVINESNYNLEELNYFNNLIYLVINEYPNYPKKQILNNKQSINLVNLKYLFLNGNCDFKLELNLPKLIKFRLSSMNNIYFKSDLNSIEHLIINKYENNIKMFTNLKILELMDNVKYNFDLITYFIKLKQLKIRIKPFQQFLNFTKDFIIFNLDMKLNLNRDIDIYLDGIKIMNVDILKEYANFNKLNFQITNYNLLDLDQFTDRIHYSNLENLFKNIKDDLPINFFDIYSNVSSIFVNKTIQNIDHFNWFISKLKRKTIFLFINLKNELLNQEFYDNLPNVIRALKIYKLNTDFNFNKLRLTKLYWFETEEDYNFFELAFNLFSNFKSLEHFAFRFNNKKIRIERLNEKYKLLISCKLKGKNLDFNRLIKLCNEFKE